MYELYSKQNNLFLAYSNTKYLYLTLSKKQYNFCLFPRVSNHFKFKNINNRKYYLNEVKTIILKFKRVQKKTRRKILREIVTSKVEVIFLGRYTYISKRVI